MQRLALEVQCLLHSLSELISIPLTTLSVYSCSLLLNSFKKVPNNEKRSGTKQHHFTSQWNGGASRNMHRKTEIGFLKDSVVSDCARQYSAVN